ncbi:hypothetical protein SLE2022_323720 [Rubroshorea leprosula]
MGGNSMKNLSHRCLRRLGDWFSLHDVHSVNKTSLTNQQWRFYSSPHNLAGIKRANLSYPVNKFPTSRYFSTTSSPKVGPLGWYLSKLESKPLITKSITTSLIFAAADVTSQMITSSPCSFDSVRTLRMAVYGLLLLGPSQHVWFTFVSKILPKRDLLTTLKKILMGQVIYGPTSTSAFFSYNAALQGESGEEIVARLKRDLLPTLINGAMYWPFCDFVTFRFIPVHLQPLMNSSCAYVWTIYLTYMANLKKVSVN